VGPLTTILQDFKAACERDKLYAQMLNLMLFVASILAIVYVSAVLLYIWLSKPAVFLIILIGATLCIFLVLATFISSSVKVAIPDSKSKNIQAVLAKVAKSATQLGRGFAGLILGASVFVGASIPAILWLVFMPEDALKECCSIQHIGMLVLTIVLWLISVPVFAYILVLLERGKGMLESYREALRCYCRHGYDSMLITLYVVGFGTLIGITLWVAGTVLESPSIKNTEEVFTLGHITIGILTLMITIALCSIATNMVVWRASHCLKVGSQCFYSKKH
jgi:hypothetical protein